MSRKAKKRSLLAVALGLVALVLAGCDGVSIVGVAPSQPEVIGAVNLDTTLCLGSTRADGTTSCPASNWSSNDPPTDAQLLVAYRVPAAADGPSMVAGTIQTDTGPSAPLNFYKEDSYANQLQHFAPAPAGEKWVGYRSDNATPNTASYNGADVTLKPAFTLRQGADGSPFGGPFRYLTVSGFRGVNTGQMNPLQDVSCGDRLSGAQTTYVQGPTTTSTGETVCVDSVLGVPSSSSAPSDPSTAPDQSADVSDVGVMPGSPTATAGAASVTVPFTLRSAGSIPAGTTFSLAGSTHVPGGNVTVSQGSATVGSNASTPLSAVFSVPGQTLTPGRYDVTLTATLPNGQSRSGTATIVVGQVASLKITQPTLSLKAPKSLTIDQFVNGFRVRGGCDIACSLRMRVYGSARSSDVGAAGFTRAIATSVSKSRRGARNVTIAPCSRGVRSAARRAACKSALRRKLERNGTTRVKLLAIATSTAGKRARSTTYIRVH